MKNTLGIYEKAFPGDLTWEERIHQAKSLGYDNMQISIDETDRRLERLYWQSGEMADLLKTFKRNGFSLESICLSAHRKYPLGSHHKELRDKGMEIMKLALEFARQTEIDIIQLAGYDVYYNETSDEDTKAYFTENLYQAVRMAEEYNIVLAFETMENDFMNTIEKAMYYVNFVNSPFLGVYPDTGNLTNANMNLENDIAAGEGHITAVHFKDSLPGIFRDLTIGEGHVDFARMAALFQKAGVSRYTVEMWYQGNPGYLDDLKKAHDYIRQYI